MRARSCKCRVCGDEITVALVQVSPSADWLCLKCSGATIEDFIEEGINVNDYSDNEVEMQRSFHGKSQWD